MKRIRIIIALGVVTVLAVGAAVVAWNTAGDGAVATAKGPGPTVPRAEVEERAANDFSYPDDEPDAVTCPGDLPAKKGAVVRCTAVFGKKSKTMEVSADKIEGDQVTLGFGLLNQG
ncbi:DUF4333 domain-containing protein [Streptomyces sp. NPDC059080]|uniref:DUF4333 domain-containing protein n=1 Tax=Streptomyces sp. NPDC059080 TaxID=3346718 RepID=UPI0036A5D855